jgi:hypothetical protein
MRTDNGECSTRHLLSGSCIGKEHVLIYPSANGKNFLLVLFLVEAGSECQAHEGQGRGLQVIGITQNRDHVRMLCKDFKLAVGAILDRSKVSILNLKPTGAHDVLPQNELLEKRCVGTEDVGKCFPLNASINLRLC